MSCWLSSKETKELGNTANIFIFELMINQLFPYTVVDAGYLSSKCLFLHQSKAMDRRATSRWLSVPKPSSYMLGASSTVNWCERKRSMTACK